MYLCLSSGSSPRYRQDVLRALALPRGTDLQFRYRRRWLSPSTIAELDNMPTDARALIAYIDQADTTKTPVLVPCRFARIVSVMKHGRTVSLMLRLDGFAVTPDLSAANLELRTLAPDLANYANGKLTGFYWTKATTKPSTVSENDDLEPWESIVEELFQHSDFAGEPFFETLAGIFADDDSIVKAVNGRLIVQGGNDYEIRVYHYHPKAAPTTPLSLVVTSTSPLVHFSTAASSSIDSPYDMKRFRFRAAPSVDTDHTVFSVTAAGNAVPASVPQLDVLVTLKARWRRYAFYGIAAGLLLAVPQVNSALTASNISSDLRLWQVVVSILFSILAGLIGAFGLKKL